MNFTEINVNELNTNFFNAIGNDWMLITAGNDEKINTMTASWGGSGVLWNKNVTFAFVRQSRYTLEFLDKNEYYTLSFFGGNMKKELGYCGKYSGRDVDKIKETGLVTVYENIDSQNIPYFEQAQLVLVCKKLYKQTIGLEGFIDKSIIDAQYSNGDLHEMFVGEIVKAIKRV